jgi:hypothetical protein
MTDFTEGVLSGKPPSSSAASALYTCFTGSTCGNDVGSPSPSPSPSPPPARPTYNTVSAVSKICVVCSGVFRLRSLVSPVTSR